LLIAAGVIVGLLRRTGAVQDQVLAAHAARLDVIKSTARPSHGFAIEPES
jgi:hypothetical protein